jgi:hypothetical protein
MYIVYVRLSLSLSWYDWRPLDGLDFSFVGGQYTFSFSLSAAVQSIGCTYYSSIAILFFWKNFGVFVCVVMYRVREALSLSLSWYDWRPLGGLDFSFVGLVQYTFSLCCCAKYRMHVLQQHRDFIFLKEFWCVCLYVLLCIVYVRLSLSLSLDMTDDHSMVWISASLGWYSIPCDI